MVIKLLNLLFKPLQIGHPPVELHRLPSKVVGRVSHTKNSIPVCTKLFGQTHDSLGPINPMQIFQLNHYLLEILATFSISNHPLLWNQKMFLLSTQELYFVKTTYAQEPIFLINKPILQTGHLVIDPGPICRSSYPNFSTANVSYKIKNKSFALALWKELFG